MIRNLKVNNKKLLKIAKTKLCIGLAVLSLSLTGCNFGWSQSKEEEISNTNTVNSEEIEYATLRINTENMTNEQIEKEIIGIGNMNDGIYGMFMLNDNGITEAGIICTDGESTIGSSIIGDFITINERLESDDIITLNINYLTREMSYTIEKEKVH